MQLVREEARKAMDGFPQVAKDGLDPQQRELWDELTLGPRGFYTGGPDAQRRPDLYNAWLQFPEFGKIVLQLGFSARIASDRRG